MNQRFDLVVLVIIDGFGWRDASAGNAMKLAVMPRYDALWQHGPRGFLRVCGPDVGLTDGAVGDSVTGHRTIGAGRAVWKSAPPGMRNLLGDVIARAGLTQLRIATPDRLAHVTSMINDGRETPLTGEQHLAASDLVSETVVAIHSEKHNFILVNIGDADTAGHTGDLDTAIEAVERVDRVLGQIAASVQAAGGALLITSDHGNCEMMRDPVTGAPHTGHTANDVPVILSAPGHHLFRDGSLADVAPTILKLFGLPRPDEMTGSALYRGNMENWNPKQRQTELITYVE